ncbi:hypothetical protein ABPG74_009945 [Tetrahymena malaccensis]
MIINNNHENGRYLMKYGSCERKSSSQIISDTRKLQDQLIMESIQKFQSKSPKINSQYNQTNIGGQKRNDQLLEKTFKQIEQIKHKHSQNFNESHFSLERIGLNPKSFQCIVYKKQPNNCVNPILEYINRNNIGIPQEIQYKSELKKSLISQKLRQMEEQQQQNDAQYYPIQYESHSFIDNRKSKLQTRYKELKNIEQDQNEYSQQAYEQLKNILSPKKKNKQENELEPSKQHNLRYKAKYSKNLQKIQIKSQMSGIGSPNNQSPQRIFSPPKNIEFNNKNQLGKLNKSGLNKSDIISPQSTPHQLQQQQQDTSQDKKNKKAGLQKKFDKKSDQLFDYLNSQKNPITVEGKIYVKDDNKNRQNYLRYSKDDLNKQDYEQNNQIEDLQMRKYSTPIKMINDLKNNLNQNQSNNQNQKPPKQRYNKSQEIQKINKTEASSQIQQEQILSQINTNFLNISNLNQKIKQQNASQIIDNQQFDDSFILNPHSQVKSIQNSVNIPTHSCEIIVSNKPGEVDPKSSQHILNNQSVILNSIADCEEADLAVQQHEVQKQCKTNKYLSRLGLNNKYSKRDYLKVQNQSQVNQEFLNINFDSENLNPKQKNINQISSKLQYSSQKTALNEKIYPQIAEEALYNKKQRSFTTQFDNNQHQNKQKYKEILPLNMSNLNQEVKNCQSVNQNQNTQLKNKQQLQFVKEQALLAQQNNFVSPELSRNMSILQQCEKESKNINQLSKIWGKNIDKMVREKNKYDQQYNNLQELTITVENTNVYQYYQKQRFNTDF